MENSLLIEFSYMPIKKKNKLIEPKVSYHKIKDKVKSALLYNNDGFTWTELKNQLKFDQIVPNNKWVKELEKDI